jgi:hypothetical protein
MTHIKNNDKMLPDPVFRVDDWCFAHIERAGASFVTITRTNNNVTLLLTFLSALAKLLEDFLDPLSPDVIVDHFSLVYELLDEIVDSGSAQALDSAALREDILRDTRRDPSAQPASVPVAATRIVSWRKEGIEDSSNEVFVDVVEKWTCLLQRTLPLSTTKSSADRSER